MKTILFNEDDTFARWWSNTTISAYIKKDN